MKKLFFIVSLITFASLLGVSEYKVPTYRLPQDIVNLPNQTTNLTEEDYNALATFFDNELERNKFVPNANMTDEQARESGLARRNFEMHFEPLYWKIFNKISDEKSLKNLPAAEYNFFLTLLANGVGLLHEQMPTEEGGRSEKVMRLLHENILNKINDSQSLQQTTRQERDLLMGILFGPRPPESIQKLTQSVIPILEKNKEQLVKESAAWDFYFRSKE